MKEIKQYAFQGDILLLRVDSVPEGYTEQQPEEGRHVVAHSETGHHHDIQAHGCKLFASESDPMTCYLQMETVQHADVVHHRPWDTHETLRLLGGPDSVWQIRHQ